MKELFVEEGTHGGVAGVLKSLFLMEGSEGLFRLLRDSSISFSYVSAGVKERMVGSEWID